MGTISSLVYKEVSEVLRYNPAIGAAVLASVECMLTSRTVVVVCQGEFVELGVVVAAHGVKGEVKVDISTDSPKQRFGKKGTK